MLTVFADQFGSFGMLIGPPEESPAAVATDAAVVSVVSLLDGGRFVANRTDSLKES